MHPYKLILSPLPSLPQPLAHLAMLFFTKTPVQGAQTTIYCAVAKEVEGQNGAYFDTCRKRKPSHVAQNDKDCQKLWEYSMKMLKLEEADQ